MLKEMTMATMKPILLSVKKDSEGDNDDDDDHCDRDIHCTNTSTKSNVL